MAQPNPRTGFDPHLVALEEVLQVLRTQTHADPLIETTINFLRTEFNYELIWLALHNSVEHTLLGKGGTSPKGDAAFSKKKLALIPGDLLDQVLTQQLPVSVPDLREEGRAGEWCQVAQRFGIQGTVIYPICYRKSCLGLVLLGSSRWGANLKSDETSRLGILLGTLGAALDQIGATQSQNSTQAASEPLLSLLGQIGALSTLQQQLLAVVLETQKFLTPTRTSVYWFEPQRQLFWRRSVSATKINQPRDGQKSAPQEISVSDVSGFYQSLVLGQLVSIADLQTAVKPNVPLRLMQQLKAQSLLAVPIRASEQLLGFLALESQSPRIWQDPEKAYLQAVAQLIAMIAPLEQVEQVIQQAQEEQALLSGLTRAICSDQDWKDTLRRGAEQLCKQLQVERVLLLLNERDTGRFAVCFQNQFLKHRTLPESLPPLGELDWQMLERATGAIQLENLESDLRLLSWREVLLGLGVKSLLACSTMLDHSLEGVLLVAQSNPRTWTIQEQETVKAVAQQFGLILHQWQLQRQADQQQRVYTSIEQGLISIQKTQNLESLEQSALQDLMQVLEVPLALLVTWKSGETQGRLVSPVINNPKFSVHPNSNIAIAQDDLIQAALHHSGQRVTASPQDRLLMLTGQDITPATREWLLGIEIGQVIAIALQTDPVYEPSGVLLIFDKITRTWPLLQLNALLTLVDQLAWAHRAISSLQVLKQGFQSMEALNWYKLRRLENIYSQLAASSNFLNDWVNQKGADADVQLQRMSRHLQASLTGLPPLLKAESWQFQIEQESIALATLIKRSLDRIQPLIKQQQIWTQVHNQGGITLGGDITKIDLILCELLLAAASRAHPGGRIDIWCQSPQQEWLELSITDDGEIDPRLLLDLQHQDNSDLLAASTLDQPPGRHLKVCRWLLQQLGGQVDILKLEDGRVLSRLTLPLMPIESASYDPA
jgi:transcriptional regulator with GAF, ATPase, and Fis domain/signal transduction histidine kinase